MARKKAQDEAKESTAATPPAGKPGRSRKTPAVADIAERGRAVPLPPARATLPVISAQVRHEMIAEAAYYRAEKRGAGPGDPEQDWYEAEAEIEQMLEGLVAD